MGILEKIVKVPNFPLDTYYQEEFPKKQIILHHTCGGNADGTITWWKQDGVHVGTCIVIERNGIAFQCFSSKYWAYSLGLKNKYLQSLSLSLDTGENREREAIGVEICNWGGLLLTDTGFHPAKWDADLRQNIPILSVTIPDNEVIEYPQPFRDFKFFERYKLEQIETIKELLIYWNGRYNIPLNYNLSVWDINLEALNGKPGVWTHINYRKDKSDLHPQSEVISMLQSL
jgi:hypothetical protein